MNKDEMISIFQDSGIQADDKIFVYPNIPEKKLINAIQSHGLHRKYNLDDIVLLIDDTVFGSAKDGLLIVKDALSFKGIFEDPIFVNLDKISSIDLDGMSLYINQKKFKFTCPSKQSMYKLYQALNHIINTTHTTLDGASEDETYDSDDDSTESIDLLALQLDLIPFKEELERAGNNIMQNTRRVYLQVDGSSKSSLTKNAHTCAADAGYYFLRLILLVQLSNLVDEYSPELQKLEEDGLGSYLSALLYLNNLLDKDSRKMKNEISKILSSNLDRMLEKNIQAATNEDERNFFTSFNDFLESYAALSELFSAAYDNKQLFQVNFFAYVRLFIYAGMYHILHLSRQTKDETQRKGLWMIFSYSASLFDENAWKSLVKDEYEQKVFR